MHSATLLSISSAVMSRYSPSHGLIMQGYRLDVDESFGVGLQAMNDQFFLRQCPLGIPFQGIMRDALAEGTEQVRRLIDIVRDQSVTKHDWPVALLSATEEYEVFESCCSNHLGQHMVRSQDIRALKGITSVERVQLRCESAAADDAAFKPRMDHGRGDKRICFGDCVSRFFCTELNKIARQFAHIDGVPG